MQTGQLFFFASAAAAAAIFFAASMPIGAPKGMVCRFCPRAANESSANAPAMVNRVQVLSNIFSSFGRLKRKFLRLPSEGEQGSPSGFPASGHSAQHRDSGVGDLLVLVRLHPGDADRADALSARHDRHSALHREHRHLEEGVAPRGDAVLPVLGRAPGHRRAAALLDRDLRVGRRGAVHALKPQQMAAVVENGDDDVPLVLARLGLACGADFPAVFQGQARLGFHVFRSGLVLKAFFICSSAAGSSIVVRSPGSRPSASAWIERRSVLPERVFGSRDTKCTAFGRAMAPSCLSTVSMTSFSSCTRPAGEFNLEASFATANASGIWPFSESATPTTAHSAMFECMLTASSISRVPSRCPATLITSSVRPRMK